MAAKDASSRIKVALRGYQQRSDPLEKVDMSRQLREAAEELEASAIEQARAGGATWRQIGSCYGLTKQGAQQRFRAIARDEAVSKEK
ncbi:MAG TPA: hypothetical protein VG435_14565 [Acidimicrobiales bacterium]|nr:hypothetical protein [Acidimicrobiales bacterium]